MRRKRAVVMVASASAAVLAVGVTWLGLALRTTHGHIAMPSDDATPEQVVRTYLAAMNAHDCNTAAALSTAGGVGETAMWCRDVKSLTNTTVRRHVAEKPSWSGHRPTAEVVDVSVRFDLRWRPFHDDGSMDEGPNPWSYLLVREHPGDPWRIFGQGMG